jgi:hypothetical protein
MLINLANFQPLIKKYNIKDIDKKITIRQAIEFIKDGWDIDFYFYDKFIRYARKFDLLDEDLGKENQRNWKLRISYKNIFTLMLMPLYELFLLQQKNKDNK